MGQPTIEANTCAGQIPHILTQGLKDPLSPLELRLASYTVQFRIWNSYN